MLNNKKQEMEEVDVNEIFGQKPKFLTISVNGDIPELHVRGQFGNPVESSGELAVLMRLAEEYHTIRVYINSEGGRVDMLTELANILRKFTTVITVGGGNIASAGFSLWCIGDVRVIQPHTWIMAHRETYGMYGKTQHHKDLAEYNDKLYGQMLSDMTSCVLSEEEVEYAKVNELYLEPDELVSRGAAIYWDDYISRSADVDAMTQISLYEFKGKLFMSGSGGTLSPVQEIRLGMPNYSNEFIYNVDEYPDEWYDENETEIFSDFDDEDLTPEMEEMLVKNFAGERVDGEAKESKPDL